MWFALWFACNARDSDTDAPAFATPEAVAQSTSDGAIVKVRGNVHTVTLDSRAGGESGVDGGDGYTRLDGRWVLIRSSTPPGIAWEELSMGMVNTDVMVAIGWGLGVFVPPGGALPFPGDVVDVTGTFRADTWNGHPVPTLRDATLAVVSGRAPGAGLGDACDLDDDCDDAWICDRATATCAAPPEIGWGSDWRDVDGACRSDADCPRRQVCDTRYVVPDDGPFTWRYEGDQKRGASLCVPDPALASPAEACGRIYAPGDLQGGRWVEGREVCIGGMVQVVTRAADRDSHVQIRVPEPLVYPMADAHAWLFGATTEIGPPHKNPSRPQGAMTDPAHNQDAVFLGTVRWDEGHGWYEVHPVRAWWPTP